MAELEKRLANRDNAILTAWENREKEKQARRGKDFAVHGVRVN